MRASAIALANVVSTVPAGTAIPVKGLTQQIGDAAPDLEQLIDHLEARGAVSTDGDPALETETVTVVWPPVAGCV